MLLAQAAHVTGLEFSARWDARQMRRDRVLLCQHRNELQQHNRELVSIDARAKSPNTAVNG